MKARVKVRKGYWKDADVAVGQKQVPKMEPWYINGIKD